MVGLETSSLIEAARALARQLRDLGGDLFEVLISPGRGRNLLPAERPRIWTAERIMGALEWLRCLFAHGYEIMLRPAWGPRPEPIPDDEPEEPDPLDEADPKPRLPRLR